MGMTYAALQLTNVLSQQSAQVRALVDTGATFMCVPRAVAQLLGIDPDEVEHSTITLADGSTRRVPCIAPIKVMFGDRSYTTEALVLGDEALMGVLPMEAMDLVVEPSSQRLIPNPAHPKGPIFFAKGVRS